MQSVKLTVRFLCRLLLGITFVFSGFVKSVDPLGFSYKLNDYFAAFHMPWLSAIAIPLAMLASTAELLLGVMLLLDEGRRIAVWGIAIFMFIFTPLTLYLAIANPVSDCGCFGDAVKISNTQTFVKNLILLIAAVVLLLGRWHRQIYLLRTLRWRQYALWVMLLIAAVAPGVYSLVHLPLLDFRPYHVGASIWENMSVPEGAPQDEFSTTFVYEKDGVNKTFTEADYPWDDSTWHYVSSENQLIRKGYEPPIKEFHLIDSSGQDIAPQILQAQGDRFLVVWPFLDQYPRGAVERLRSLAEQAVQAGLPLAVATSSPPEVQAQFAAQAPGVTIYSGDERVLKTVVRANPGVVLLHDGVVLGKWKMRDMPEPGYFSGNLLSKVLTADRQAAHWHWYLAIAVVLLVIGLYSTFVRRADRRANPES